MIVAQLAEESIPTPEVHGSNPIIDRFLKRIVVFVICGIEETKIKKKLSGRAPKNTAVIANAVHENLIDNAQIALPGM